MLLQAGLLLGGCDSAAEEPATQAPAARADAAEPPAAQAPQGPERLVLAFGDSLYAGYRLAAGESLPARLQAELRAQGMNATVVNAGVSGDTTAAGRQRLAFALDNLPRKPDLVLLGLGGNDMLRQIPPAETRANLTAMMDELRRRDIPVLLTGMMAPPNLGGDYAAAFNRIWPDLVKSHDAGLYPFILAGVVGNPAFMLPDHVHPNARGVAKMSQAIAPLLAERLKALPAA